jgi:hypothetical protein
MDMQDVEAALQAARDAGDSCGVYTCPLCNHAPFTTLGNFVKHQKTFYFAQRQCAIQHGALRPPSESEPFDPAGSDLELEMEPAAAARIPLPVERRPVLQQLEGSAPVDASDGKPTEDGFDKRFCIWETRANNGQGLSARDCQELLDMINHRLAQLKMGLPYSNMKQYGAYKVNLAQELGHEYERHDIVIGR